MTVCLSDLLPLFIGSAYLYMHVANDNICNDIIQYLHNYWHLQTSIHEM